MRSCVWRRAAPNPVPRRWRNCSAWAYHLSKSRGTDWQLRVCYETSSASGRNFSAAVMPVSAFASRRWGDSDFRMDEQAAGGIGVAHRRSRRGVGSFESGRVWHGSRITAHPCEDDVHSAVHSSMLSGIPPPFAGRRGPEHVTNRGACKDISSDRRHTFQRTRLKLQLAECERRFVLSSRILAPPRVIFLQKSRSRDTPRRIRAAPGNFAGGFCVTVTPTSQAVPPSHCEGGGAPGAVTAARRSESARPSRHLFRRLHPGGWRARERA